MRALRDKKVSRKNQCDVLALDLSNLELDLSTVEANRFSKTMLYAVVCRMARVERVLPATLPRKLLYLFYVDYRAASFDESVRHIAGSRLQGPHISERSVYRRLTSCPPAPQPAYNPTSPAYSPVTAPVDAPVNADTNSYCTLRRWMEQQPSVDGCRDPFCLYTPHEGADELLRHVVFNIKEELGLHLNRRELAAVYYAYAIECAAKTHDVMGCFLMVAPFTRVIRTPREQTIAMMVEAIAQAGPRLTRASLERMHACMDPPVRAFEALALLRAWVRTFEEHRHDGFDESDEIFEWFMEDDAARVRDAPGAWRVIGEIGMLLEDGELLKLGGEMRLGIGCKRPYGHGYGYYRYAMW